MVENVGIEQLLDATIAYDASDLHLVVGEPPTLRVHGGLKRLTDYGTLEESDTKRLVESIARPRSMNELGEVQGADFGYTYGNKARFRVAAFIQKGTIALNMRLIPYRLLNFEQLGLKKSVIDLLYQPRGLILVTGPTGSGKTTTLATMIDFINTNRDCHIITIEDPIEYYHTPKKSIISQREVGNDVPSFAVGVIKAMRQDPDVILVGEMRDLSTISAAVTAAETGHLVFSTLHTTGSARTVDRIVDVFPFDQQEQIRTQLSGNLIAVISQLLLPKADGKGRVAVYEVMIATAAIQHMIRDKKTHSIFSAIQTGQQLGMQSLDHSLWERYQQNLLSRDTILRMAAKPEELLEKMGERTPTAARAPASK
ncbi:MAG: type IV pilus twitching motility protein PilT [Armatimonadetes bacterium]|nr:type IV pilus twitching motility protein PilT [Armatimonadota bacterium]